MNWKSWRSLKELEFDRDEVDVKIAEEKEKIETYRNGKFEYERLKAKVAVEKRRLLEYEERERDINLQGITPYIVQRKPIGEQGESVVVPKQPVETWPWKHLIVIACSSLATSLLLFGLLCFSLSRAPDPDTWVEPRPADSEE